MSIRKVQELQRYPKFYDNYMRAIEKFLPAYLERCAKKNRQPFRKTAQEWMEWWLEIEVDETKNIDGQVELDEDIV